MPLDAGPPTPPMEPMSLTTMPVQTSKAIQNYLLSQILLLPGVDPVLANFIKGYLESANTNNSTPPNTDARLTQHSQVDEVSRDNISAESTVDNQLRLACEPVASSVSLEARSSGLHSRRGRSSRPSNTRSEVQLKTELTDAPSSPDAGVAAEQVPTPPISNPATRTLSTACSTSSTETPVVPNIVVHDPPTPPSAVADIEDEDKKRESNPCLPLLVNGNDTYVAIGTLGNGGSGRVMYARSHKGRAVAVKVVHKPKVYRHGFARYNIMAEKECLERVTLCGKPFLTQLLSSWDDEDNVYFVMRMFHENLWQRLNRGQISPEDLKIYIAELISALANVHASGVVHRDIKPENILIAPSGHLSLADFGLAFLNKTDARLETCYMTDLMGTPGYWAPEVATSTRTTGYNCLADVWSMGMVIFEMYHGMLDPFFEENSYEGVVRDMMCNDVPLDTVKDEGIRNLLKRMLAKNPHHRSSAKELKDDPYFADIEWHLLANGEYKPKYRPPFPTFDGPKPSIRFSSFHFGLDVNDGKSVHLNSEGFILPNSSVLRQLNDDRFYPTMRLHFRYPISFVYEALHNGSVHSQVNDSDEDS